jgi:hypothetical protein
MNIFTNPFRRKAKAPRFIISNDLAITLVLDGQTHPIGTTHPNHGKIIEALDAEDFDVLSSLVNIPKAMNAYSGGSVVVNEYGEVAYNGEAVHDVISRRIQDFFQRGEDFKPLVKFLENLMENPSFNSRAQLYTFLENEGLSITEDGCFVGYKGVDQNLKDKHTHTFDNSVGQTHEMNRSLVDDNPNNHCSSGFHVGSQSYASDFGNRMVLVKVNPRDAVSVPSDHNNQKLRCCRYEVLEEVKLDKILVEPLYSPQTNNERDCCSDCGESFCVCDDECSDCGYPEDDCECY